MAGSRAGQQPGLQIGVDPSFDRIQWRVERFAWILMALVILLALLGFFGGGGPLMRATERSGDSEVRYNRMIRFQGQTRLEITVPGSGGEARITFNQPFLADMQIEGIHPEPAAVRAGSESVTYVFELAEGEESADVSFSLRPEKIGVHSANIVTASGTLSVWQLALP
ncbi:MAG: hypothetical protein WD557_07650 [Dehalococcoidia bacterium]